MQDPNLGFTEETLLVEFIYYGHAVNRESDSSEGYAGSSTTFPYVSSVSEEIESSDQETLGRTINQSRITITVGDTSVFVVGGVVVVCLFFSVLGNKGFIV